MLAGTWGASLQAGLSTMASHVGSQMVIHGDPFKAFESLGDKGAVRQVITSMATAGILDKLGQVVTLNPSLGLKAPGYLDFLKAEGIKAGVSTVLDVAICNQKLEKALVQGVKKGIVQSIANNACHEIGQQLFNTHLHKAAHFVVGGVSELALGGPPLGCPLGLGVWRVVL